ncbi:MAG: YkgJ family cysteine cluster protein [Thermoguttaceae bacterium]|nr:YkgJ family cysteine cluster protein [Thermoguttaceae bacterium]
MSKRQIAALADIPAGKCACDLCDGRCCRYIALPYEPSDGYEGFDQIRWFISHRSISVFRDDGMYYLLVQSPCRFLDERNRCGCYADRPQICRDYSADKCEYWIEGVFDGYFEVPEQVEEYAEAVLGPRPGAPFRSKRPADQ